MNYTNILELMLTGKMEMGEFIDLLKTDDGLQEYLKRLIPKEAVCDSQHHLWDNISRDFFAANDFDLLKVLQSRYHFDGTISDNLNVFSVISRIYCIYQPHMSYTSKYKDEFKVYLDIGNDCFEGPEVQHILEQIVKDTSSVKPKSKRLKDAKCKVKAAFHVEGKVWPRWIQGAEWPMGENSPMKFVSQSKIEDGKQYLFRDIDTGEIRLIQQYY